ncbi:acyl-CoA dehydrogenase domain-containing protein [Rhodococcus ruber BKS 20-38]|uniref:Acyl-CoA dehydrogenase domain-containing protein n=1 Tax=Rhodococcus ruber BKS 20-38 TaxID=1278076 RepID=M3A4C1_9NOCA|nr:acyl-CoA dehydrogenase family protein [Rhodococcus ruber]EME67329.1 acyl-CoA dehydrogenase domain-containing protein [Rhodococcus ruber BKS 20-38]
MDLKLTAEQSDFRDTIRRFLEKEAPISSARESAQTEAGFDREWWTRATHLGVAAPLVPEELGGGSVSGSGVLDLAMIAEEFGASVAPGPLAATNIVLAGLTMAEHTRPGHADLIEQLTSGEQIATWAVSEPRLPWAPDDPQLTAKASAAGFTLDGVKDRVEFGAESDVFLVTARTENGVSQFVVPVGSKGLTVASMVGLDLARRYAELRFDSVELPTDALVGLEGEAATVVERQALIAGVLQCAETVGILNEVFRFTLEWAFDRYSFGRPLASYQALKHRFADMRTWIEACAAISSDAAHAVQNEVRAAETVSAAKSYICDVAPRIIQDCVQLHGGIGVTWEHDLHLFLRRAVANRSQFGTPEDHRRRIADLIEL